MAGIKRPLDSTCPNCKSKVDSFEVNVNYSVEMCENVECAYPFDQPIVEGLIIETPYNDIRYSKKLKTRSSSVANTAVASSKASDVDDISVKSAKEFRSEVSEPSFLIKQKDQLHLENNNQELALEDIMQYITQASPPPAPVVNLPTNIALPPASAAKSSSALSLQDLESLLNNTDTQEFLLDCSSPSSSTINTPKDVEPMTWMEDLDVLFGADMAQSKFDPLQGDNEFDSLLGI